MSGWYDAQGQGVANDYCRMVGPSAPPYNLVWFSCALAGTPLGNAGCAYTAPGEYVLDPDTNTIINPHVTYGGLPASVTCVDPANSRCSNPNKVSALP